MQLVMCDCCPPCAQVPAAPPAADAGHYEELPVSVPPHVPQGLRRDDAPGLGLGLLDQWEEGAYAEAMTVTVEQLPVPPPPPGHQQHGSEVTETGGGAGAAGPWLLAAFASLYSILVVPVSFCRGS